MYPVSRKPEPVRGQHQSLRSASLEKILEHVAKQKGYDFQVVAREGEDYQTLSGAVVPVPQGKIHIKISGFNQKEGLGAFWNQVALGV